MRGRITRQGNKLVRWVEAAQAARMRGLGSSMSVTRVGGVTGRHCCP